MYKGRIFGCIRRFSVAIENKAYIQINGTHTRKFLQSLITNDINNLGKARGDSIASTFLTNKGRILSDSIIINLKEETDGISSLLVEIDNESLELLLNHLQVYKLRSKITIQKDTSVNAEIIPYSEMQLPDSISNNEIIYKDPRSKDLGHVRLMFHSNQTNNNRSNDYNKYKIYRYMYGIAEGREIFNKIPLECNLDLLNYISFKKGCYLGQELIARTKFKGVVRKRIVPFTRILNTKEPIKPNVGTFTYLCKDYEKTFKSIIDSKSHDTEFSNSYNRLNFVEKMKIVNENNKTIGEILCVDDLNIIGLSIINLEELVLSKKFYATIKENSTTIENGITHTEVIPFRPSWWPDVDPFNGRDFFQFN